jgi:hypothetical protein
MIRMCTAAAGLAAWLMLVAAAQAQSSGVQNTPPSGSGNARAQIPTNLRRQSMGEQGADVRSERNLGGSAGSVAPAPPRSGSQPSNVPANPLAAPSSSQGTGSR